MQLKTVLTPPGTEDYNPKSSSFRNVQIAKIDSGINLLALSSRLSYIDLFTSGEISMLSRCRLLILIPAIVLIPILLGMIPLNMAHRLASGGPLTHCRQVQLNNHCPFNSLISHDDPTIINLNVTPLHQESMPGLDIHILDSDSVHSNAAFNSFPLRC